MSLSIPTNRFFRFDEKKATEAAAYLLKLSEGKMNYMKLIKLLYLADRKSIHQYGSPIVGDMYCAMKNGPVLSTLYDYITDEVDNENPTYWSNYIERNNYDVALKSDPGKDELSTRNEKLLKEIFKRFEDYNEWKMVNFCHEYLTEWRETYDGYGSPEISVKKIFKVLEKDEEELEYLKNKNELYSKVKQLLKG